MLVERLTKARIVASDVGVACASWRFTALAGNSDVLDSLCEAYGDASVTLERILREPRDMNGPMVMEYQTICSEIESDVIRYFLCLHHSLAYFPAGPRRTEPFPII